MSFKKRAVWCGSSEAGHTQDSVVAYVDRMHRAGFNAILVHLKGGDGLVYWPSQRFPQTIAPGYESFDLPAALLAECRKRGMEIHAWFIDYFEGNDGAAYREHPEWAATNPKGEPTTSEILRGQQFTGLWMCPARRPGYTDQWLVPLYEEFAERYDFDAIHHDYVRYPGDMAPDTYCFCDYCLENIPKFNGFVSEKYPDEPFYHELYDRSYLEAHWEQSPRVLPDNWDAIDRETKSRFLLDGAFFRMGRQDLDYFYYTYRTHWVTEFARLAAEAVRRARPGMQLSAAVFKNPIHSGRFIGQDWRQFAPYVETCIPMDYRDHFPGTFEQYLDLLEEAIHRQKEWARDYKSLWIGFAINFLFFEEERPLRQLRKALETSDREATRAAFFAIEDRVRLVDPTLHARVSDTLFGGVGDEAATLAELRQFTASVPKAYWPKEKLERVIERIASTGVEGISIFSEGQIHEYGMWDCLTEAFLT